MESILPLLTTLVLSLTVVYLIGKSGREKELQEKLQKAERRIAENQETLEVLLSFLSGVHEFGVASGGAASIEKLGKLIVTYATRLVKAEAASLMLVKEDKKILEVVSAVGLPEGTTRKTGIQIGEGIPGKAAELGEPILCEDVEKDGRFSPEHDRIHPSGCLISIPLMTQGKPIGVLNVNSRVPGAKFDEKDLALLTILANQSAMIIENTQLYKHMQDTYLGTIQTLARAIDAKDPYTRGHSERVTKYAVAIAKEMKLSDTLVQNIQYASLIHDIGKIGIREEILSKNGSLSGTEFEVIKMHPLIGESIITPVKFLNGIAPLILYHHEHFDGGGYLEGLKGEEIPLGARIISVADAFDALTSERPYRKRLSKEEALRELKKESGRKFDPQVIEALARVIKRGEE